MSKFNNLFNEVINEAGVVDKLRSMNYKRLANRSKKEVFKAKDKMDQEGWTDENEKEFSKQMSKMRQREKKSKELKG